MKALSKLQVWTTPLWLVLMIGPVAHLIYQEPTLVSQFATFTGNESFATVDMAAIMLGAGICLSLIMQIGEQIDYVSCLLKQKKIAKHGGLRLFQRVRW